MCICSQKEPKSPGKKPRQFNKPQSSMNVPYSDSKQITLLHNFVDQFWSQLEQSSKMLKEAINLIESQENVNGYQALPQYAFESIRSLYKSSQEKSLPDVDLLIQRLNEPRGFSYSYIRSWKRMENQTLLFLQDIKNAILKGYLEQEEDFKARRAHFKSEDSKLLRQIEEVIELAKDSVKKERSRIFVEELGSGEELKENKQLRELVENQQERISKLQERNERLTNENNTYEAVTIPSLKFKIAKYESNPQKGEKERVIGQQQQKINSLEGQLSALSNLGNASSNPSQTFEVLEEEISKLKKENNELSQLVKELAQSSGIKSNQSQFQVLVSEKERLLAAQEELLQKDKELASALKELKDSKHERDLLQAKAEEQQKNLAKTRRQLLETEEEIERLKELNMELGERIEELRGDSTRFRTKSFVEHNTLFIGDILQSRKSEKRYLLKSIENLKGREIIKTKLLYEYLKDKQINFHKIIDEHSNLVLIAETVQGILVAGFYSGVYRPKTAMTQEALLLSLTNYQCYSLSKSSPAPKKDNKKEKPIYGMVYDEFFLIFGNSELRIKSGQKKLFSNFGVNNAYFNSRGDKVAMMLGQGKTNEVEMVNYQIHQAYFDYETL